MADFVSDLDLAYAAGIIDGEGTIGISEYAPKGKRRSPQFRCYLSVGQTDVVIPMFLADLFGGTVHSYEPRQPGHKGMTIWRIQNRRAATAAEQLLPFLRLKARQAELLVDFYNDPRFAFVQRQGIPEPEVLGRREYVHQIHALNARGNRGGQ